MSNKIDLNSSKSRYAELKKRQRSLEMEMGSLQKAMAMNRAETAVYDAEECLRMYKKVGLTKGVRENVTHLYANYLHDYNPDSPVCRGTIYEGRALEVVREMGRIYKDIVKQRHHALG